MTVTDICRAFSVHKSMRFDLDGCGNAYLRAYPRIIGHDAARAITIADINVNEECRQRGIFTNAVINVEQAARRMGIPYVFVECILNPIVIRALERRGYIIWHRGGQVDAYKRLSD